MSIAVLGAGAFGTALAICLAQKGSVFLWGRDKAEVAALHQERKTRRLDGVLLPEAVEVTSEIAVACAANILLLAIPAQQLPAFARSHAAHLARRDLVACCKGLNLDTGEGPTAILGHHIEGTDSAILTGPSFAADMARGLPTALTLACVDGDLAKNVQDFLSTDTLRIYRSTDPLGAELGGALKNVVAIACGTAIGLGLGESARAAVMTRGFAEMNRLGDAVGARRETLAGLAGLGDLTLTCTSDMSRNYRFGLSLGRQVEFDSSLTVEGKATAEAVEALAVRLGLDLPVMRAVAKIGRGDMSATEAMDLLLRRPLRAE